MNFLQELKRRHVYRVAAAYAVVGWLLIQVATQVFPVFHLPDWIDQAVVLLILIGFPIALVLAWAFDATPQGIVATDAQDAERNPRVRRRSRRAGIAVGAIGVLIALIAGGAYWHFGRRATSPAAETAHVATSRPDGAQRNPGMVAAQPIPAKSIAVLPFENLSSDKDNAYFSDGMQDLILTKLADIGELKVISRTSTMKYASHPDDLKTIAQQLGVATILEGSVQKAGNQVLINVQLIDAKTDAHLWAQSYTRTLDNVFGVEGEVAGQIATALKAKLSPAETKSLATALSADPAANDLFLRGEYFFSRGDWEDDVASVKQAIPLYRQAIAKVPDFALARAKLSWAESDLVFAGGAGEDIQQLNTDARAQAEQALALAPDLVEAHLAIGYYDLYGRRDYPAALAAFDAALKLRPNDANVLASRGNVLAFQGHFADALTAYQQALASDPRNSDLARVVGQLYQDVGRYTEAQVAYQHALALDPNNTKAKADYSQFLLFASGDVAAAWTAAQGDGAHLRGWRIRLLRYQRKYQEALALLASIPDTPDNFAGGSKALQQANLYRLSGDMARAKPLFEQALPIFRAKLTAQAGSGLAEAEVWTNVADAELGLGHTAAGLAAIPRAQAFVTRTNDHINSPRATSAFAGLYAEADRPDLAVPLLEKALATPGIGYFYSPVMLWIDPAWDPIRRDPRFQALLKKYAKYKPPSAETVAPSAYSTATPVSANTNGAAHG